MRPVSPSELPEFLELQALVDLAGPAMERRVLCSVDAGGEPFEVQAFLLGSERSDVPAVGFFGGVHGLERIGAQVTIAYLRNIVTRLQWDTTLQRQLETLRLVFLPIVNPGGLWLGTRANPRGVDLMRNAPVDALGRVPWLLGGQRLSATLPWYRGVEGAAMESESQALCALVESELLSRPFSIALDCHSGFGLADRLWFPYAHTPKPMAHLPEMHALGELIDLNLMHHPYVLEPQSRQYTAHGDLWDHLYLTACTRPDTLFLPLTLEMGSWLWVKKNPRQLFSRHGIFNPVIAHRQQRVLRRHLWWMDFITRAASSHTQWVPVDEARRRHHAQALARWYEAA